MDAKAPCFAEETVYYSMTVLRLRKNAFIVLHHKRHAMILKPAIGILVIELLEKTFKQTCPTRVSLLKV